MSPLDRLRWVAAVASADLPGACTRLAAHLALMAADGTGAAWPSRPRLAKALGCDEARLVKVFRDLSTAGFVSRGELTGPFGRQTFRWLLIPPAESAPGTESAPGAESAGAPPAESATDPLRKAHPKGGNEGGSKEVCRPTASDRFAKPTADEVQAYCQERNNGIDPERFVDHYEANGWRVGKSPMKDWRAAVRTWERNDRTPIIPIPIYAPAPEMHDYTPAGAAS